MISRFGAAAVVLLLAGCAPPLGKPDLAVATNGYLPGPASAAAMTDAPLPVAWWEVFGSPALDRLVADGLAANPSIGQAAQTLIAAQAAQAASTGAYLPQIGINPDLSRQSYPTGPNGYPPYTIYSLTGTISYDPGLFGARHYSFANAQAEADYSQAELAAARQSVAGNIAAAAIGEAGYEAQIAATEQIIAAEQRLLMLLQGEYNDGAIPQINVLQQESQVQASQATLPPLETQAGQLRDSISILTGRMPADFAASGISLEALSIPATLPVSLPSAYLANRPDLRAARAQVAAQNAALGIAVAQMYPDLTLTASGGYAAETLNSLFEPGAAFWSLAGNLLQPLYDGGVLHARRQQAQAQLAAALFAYHDAVLAAFGQAADALLAVQNGQQAMVSATAAAATASQAYKLASAQFSLGATDYTTVLAAQQTAAQQSLALVQAWTALLLDIAKLQSVMAR